MRRPAATLDRLCSLAAVCGFALIAACALRPAPASLLSRDWSSLMIYPWWTLALVAAGLVAALAGMGERGRVTAALPGLTGVVGAQLAGLGIVARKHWLPSFGMGGGYAGEVDELRRLALVIGVTGAALALVSLAQLVLRGLAPVSSPPRPRRTAAVVGVGLLLLLPVAIGIGSAETLDATSLGAYALIYSVPWGVSVVGTGWLSDRAAIVVVTTCLGCAVLALVGPQMTDMVFDRPWPAFSVAVVVLAFTHRALTRRS